MAVPVAQNAATMEMENFANFSSNYAVIPFSLPNFSASFDYSHLSMDYVTGQRCYASNKCSIQLKCYQLPDQSTLAYLWALLTVKFYLFLAEILLAIIGHKFSHNLIQIMK